MGITEYGLVTVGMFHIPTALIEDTQLGTFEMASSQEHFYKYVANQRTPLVEITEDVLNTTPTYQLDNIIALVRYNLMLATDELNVVSFLLSDFEQQDLFFDLDPNAARTYVPDDVFEQKLIDLGYDDVLDDYVFTANIVGVEELDLVAQYYLEDFTGIEDFQELKSLAFFSDAYSLEIINFYNNTKLESLTIGGGNFIKTIDTSNNVKLKTLDFTNSEFMELSSLDLSKNTALENLYLGFDQLTNLDVSNNTVLTSLSVSNSYLLTCIQVNQTQLNAIPAGWTAGANYSLNCSNIQDRLDSGETPFEIYESDNSLLNNLYGKTYAGGLIFYLDLINGIGMISAPSDQSTAQWGCNGTYIANASNPNIWGGKGNTNLIISECTESGIAAEICASLDLNNYDDWYLPSKDELNLLYINLHLNGLGGFTTGSGGNVNGWYWSSTEGELDGDAAWVQSFKDGQNGIQVTYDIGVKDFTNHVRAIRNF